MTLIADRYKLAESIGTGGMSNVYAAEDTLLGRGVAVKMLKVEMARDEGFRERFRREAQNSARLTHPNIVAVYDTGDTLVDGVSVPYIVMERVHGKTLRDIVRERGVLPAEQAASLLSPVCAALQASHNAGIIHRDIKPANIMVTPIGDVKVMDFGIARALDDSTSAMTQTSAVIGTAQYLSPEQARGKNADARSDVYALGCVFYEAVTGQPPFYGETPFAVAYQHVQEDAQPPSERIVGGDLTPTEAVNVDAVALTAMAKHPADRYQSAQEMGEDLDRLSRGSVTRAARSHVETGAADQTHPPTATVPTISATSAGAASAGAATAASAGATESAEPGTTSRRNEHRPGRRRAKSGTGVIKALAITLATLLALALGLFGWNFYRDSIEDSRTAQINSVTVPEVARASRADAINQLRGLGFTVEEEERPSPDIARGNAIATEPAAGSSLREGSTVRLIVSSGQELTDVPDLRGMDPTEASSALEEAGLELSNQVEESSSDSVPAGQISEQHPPAGSRVAKGTQIAITVSSGKETARIPSLTNMQWDEAEATLSSLGFTPTPEYVDSVADEGQVLEVGGAGTEAPRGSEVVVRVSNGQIFQMPNITRMEPDDAVRALHMAGWTGDPVQLQFGRVIPTGALVDDGLIGYQEQKTGTEVRKDATINVRAWKFDLGALAGG